MILKDLLNNLVLLEEDRALMRARGFPEETIDSKGWRSCHPSNVRAVLALKEKYSTEDLAQAQILLPTEMGEWIPNPQLLDKNILIPYYNGQGEILKVRPHKLGFKGEPAMVYRTPASYRVGPFCIIAESEFKADAAECYGYSAIGIPGIKSMSSKNLDYFVKELESIRTSQFIICFDNEIKNNPAFPNFKADWRKRYDTIVYAFAMCQKILNAGMNCKIATLPSEWMENGKIDIDKALAQGHSFLEMKGVLDNALAPQPYLKSAPIPEHHRSYVNRCVKKTFYVSNILLKGNCYFSKAKDDDKSRRLTNFSMKIQNTYEELGPDGQGLKRDLILTDDYGIETRPIMISANAMASRASFKSWLMGQGNYLFYGTEGDTVAVWEHVFSEDESNVVYLLNQVGHVKEYKFWIFKNVMLKDGKTVNADDTGIFWLNEVGYKPIKRVDDDLIPSLSTEGVFNIHEFLRLLGDTIDTNTPGMSKAIFAWFLAVMFMEPIIKKYDLFPLLFIYGIKGGGKTTICRWLRALFGLDGSTISLSISSPVGVQRALSRYANLPIITDDWRDDYSSKRYVTMFLGVYNRQVGLKGTKSHAGIQETDVRGALAVLGEELISDNGLASRCVHFYIPKDRRRECLDEMESLLPNASKFLYDILMNDYPATCEKVVKQTTVVRDRIRKDIPGIESRLVINYSILIGAYEAILGEDLELYNYIKNKINNSQQEITEGDKLHTFAHEFMYGVAENRLTPMYYQFNAENPSLMYLWIKGICAKMNEVYRREVDSSNILIKHFESQPYFKRAVRLRFSGGGGAKFPAIEIDLRLMPESLRTCFEVARQEIQSESA